MGVVTPNGDMYLVYVDIDPANQMYFTSKTAQETFFQSKAVAGVAPADYTFIQKDDMIRVNRNADLLYNANYLMYRNTAHADRWFYAYIKEIKWISDSSSAISFETDPYQTWRWDISFRQSIVERETPPSDVVGEHLIDEGLDLGEYVSRAEIKSGLGPLVICIATTVSSATKSGIIEAPWAYTKVLTDGKVINNVYSASEILWYPNDAGGRFNVNEWLKDITDAGASDAITAVYMCPEIAVRSEEVIALKATERWSGYIKDVSMGARPTSVDNYIPKNKKLLSYPYCLVYVHNGNGSSAAYDIDEFKDLATGVPIPPTFELYGNINPMPQFKLIPEKYKGVSLHVDEAINLQNFPMCSYPIDGYKAWSAQNGTSAMIGVAGGAASAAAGVGLAANSMVAGAALGPGGVLAGAGVTGVMAISGVTNAAQSLAKLKEASLHPDQAQGSATSGSVNASFNGNDFYLCYKTIRHEWAKMLDDYFTMYGYKVNKLKVPSFGCRTKWYYCKLINPNITGGIPAPELGKLKQMFENGITLWNNHADIGQYHLANDPVGVG